MAGMAVVSCGMWIQQCAFVRLFGRQAPQGPFFHSEGHIRAWLGLLQPILRHVFSRRIDVVLVRSPSVSLLPTTNFPSFSFSLPSPASPSLSPRTSARSKDTPSARGTGAGRRG